MDQQRKNTESTDPLDEEHTTDPIPNKGPGEVIAFPISGKGSGRGLDIRRKGIIGAVISPADRTIIGRFSLRIA